MAWTISVKLKKFSDPVIIVLKILSLLLCLYFFICSLSFLSDSFRILGGRNIGSLFSNSDLLKNPIVGMMIGVLVTVLVQSSSTSTSIIVGLVSAGAPVREAVPMIMGANIGTSVTNILVALTQAGEREQFRRAFACANVHDMFNWLSAFILLIVEVLTGYLELLTGFIVDHMHGQPANSTEHAAKAPDFLKALTKPFTKTIIQLDSAVLQGWATNDLQFDNSSILRVGCETSGGVGMCPYLFAYLGPDGQDVKTMVIGILLLILSLMMLCSCLIAMVKILNLLLGPKIKEMIQNVINADIPIYGLGWFTGYLAMLLGALMTVLVQSSSVFTSTLTPLAGAGLISLERAYPMTLGSNLGTTTTSLLASFAAGGSNMKEANQIALVHLFFNLTGIIIFYPIPFMRWPVAIARVLGDVTAQYRWFAFVYLCFMFFIFPSTLFLLSLAGPLPLYLFLVPAISIILSSVTVNLLQARCPALLPALLKDWTFLPEWLHSLEPWDRLVTSCWGLLSCYKPREDTFQLETKDLKTAPEFGDVAYNRLNNIPSSTSICTGVVVVKDANPRQEEEYNLLINYPSQTPSPRDMTPRRSM